MNQEKNIALESKPKIIPKEMIIPFIMVTSLFALWGFANDITNPMVSAFKQVFLINNTQSSLIQFAFYGGYATMAIPAALFMRKFSYKAAILLGLALYATGALLFIPAAQTMEFYWFPISLYILTFGLAFLETTSNPYILSMGPVKTSTLRLNLAQAFNPIGSLLGMLVAKDLILAKLWVSKFRAQEMAAHPEYKDLLPSVADGKITDAFFKFKETNPEEYTQHQIADVSIIEQPYVILGIVVLIIFFIFLLKKLPNTTNHDEQVHPIKTAKRLLSNKRWREGVFAQTFYVAAQITCWTYIVQYAMTNVGLSATEAQSYNMVAMGIFLVARFACTILLKYISSGKLLMTLGFSGAILMVATMLLQNQMGLYCLVAISGCMSLMFPTIYGIALDGLGEDAKLGSAGLVFAIVGGALMPMGVGYIMDLGDINIGFMTLTSVSAAFVLPLISFIVVTIFGWRTHNIHHASDDTKTA